MMKFLEKLLAAAWKHKKKVLTVISVGAAAAADGATGFGVLKQIAKAVMP